VQWEAIVANRAPPAYEEDDGNNNVNYDRDWNNTDITAEQQTLLGMHDSGKKRAK